MANTMSLTLPMCFVITRPMLYAIHYLFVVQSRNQYCAPYIISPCCRRDITTYELRKHMSIALLIHFWGVLTDSTSRTLPSGDVMTWTGATDVARRDITDACCIEDTFIAQTSYASDTHSACRYETWQMNVPRMMELNKKQSNYISECLGKFSNTTVTKIQWLEPEYSRQHWMPWATGSPWHLQLQYCVQWPIKLYSNFTKNNMRITTSEFH